MKHKLKVVSSAGSRHIPALETVDLSSRFTIKGITKTVFKEVNITITGGELVCLLGPSGCGKTTLLHLIAGFVPPSGGQLLVDNRPVGGPGADRCVVFQEDALFPWLTVAENIAFGLKGRMNRKARNKAVAHHLELVGLTDFRDYLPRQLSGGMKQRVALARVLVLEPHLLLMDEPFGALDAQTREEMQDLLLSLWVMLSPTIVFVTHDIREAILLADRILIMGKHAGGVYKTIAVTLPRPRRKESDAFHRFYQQVRKELTESTN